MVKSIQMHDDNVDEAISPARVGLSLKGVKPDEITRGDVLCEDDSLPISSEIELDFKKNPFYKDNFAENQMCLVNIGLQIKAAKFNSTEPVRLTLDKHAVYDKSDTAVILKPESDTIRILGSVTIK
jgi:selenocysteine-specific translation elongation factor